MSDVKDLIASAHDDAEAIARHLLGDPNPRLSSRRQLRWGVTGRLCMALCGPHKGKWTRHGSDEHGDALDLVQVVLNLDLPGALKWLRQDWFSDTAPIPIDRVKRNVNRELAEVQHQLQTAKRGDRAAKIWVQSRSIRGTLGHAYLLQRLCGFQIPDVVLDSDALRWNGKARVPGAMGAVIALMTEPVSGKPVGIHRTFVTADGTNVKDGDGRSMRLMLGNKGVVRLWPDDAVTYGLTIGEGIETTIAGALLMDSRPAWAALDAGNLAVFPVLSGIDALTILTDNDKSQTGQRAADTCAGHWTATGRQATILTPPTVGMDFADFLKLLTSQGAS